MSNEHADVVEIDAIAGEEWDHDQHTPVQVEANLAELVKQSGLDDGWDAGAKDEAAALDKPRTTTNTMRRTSSAPALPSKVHKTMALPTVAVVKPAPAKSTTKTTATRAALPPKSPKQGAVAPTFSPFGNEPTTPSPPAALASSPSAATASKPAAPAASKPAVTAKQPAAPVVAKPAAAAKQPAAPAVAKLAVTAKQPAAPAASKSAKITATSTPSVAAAPASANQPAASAKAVATAIPTTELAGGPAKADLVQPIAPEAHTADVKPTKLEVSPVAASVPVSPPLAPPLAPSALELPVWPPRLSAALRAGSAPHYEDWDELGGATSVGNHVHPQPSRKPGDDSVIVDLDAVSKTERQPARRAQTAPILTSDHAATTSGAFVMPTAARPQAAQVADRPSVAQVADRPSTAWHTPLPLAPPPLEPAPQWPSAAGLDYASANGSAPEIPLPVTRPDPRPDPTEPHLARRTLLATVFPTPTSRKKGLLAAAGAVAVILVIVLVSGGSGSGGRTTAKPADDPANVATHAAPPSAPPSASASTRAATAQPAVAPVAVATADPAERTAHAPATTDATSKRAVPARRRISRKRHPVVVDYDKRPDPTPEQDEALSRARGAYAAGNQHLFAGETAAAIASYQQALADY
ncbi:MAG: hypothetical protein ABI467_28450, partial [Kofleriaceae bacterium]